MVAAALFRHVRGASVCNGRWSAAFLAVAIVGGFSGCDFGTSQAPCAYAGFTPGLTISAIDSVTQQPPTAVPVITATASNGTVTRSTGAGAIDGDSLEVSVYVGPGVYTITITTPGYETIDVGQLVIAPSSDLSCNAPFTQFMVVSLTPVGTAASRTRRWPPVQSRRIR
jgi:hypothetical protein